MTKKHIIPTITGLLLLLGAVLLITSSPSSAQSGPQTWQLQGVTFDTGATASGTFTFDADTGSYSNINVTISNSPVNGTNTHLFPNPASLGNDVFFSAVPEVPGDLTGVKAVALVFASSLTNAGGTVDIQTGSSIPSFQGTCNVTCVQINGPYDRVVSGRVTTSIDTIAPNAAPTPTPFPNLAGWHNADVTVTWNWQDDPGGTGIDTNDCPPTSSSSGEGTIAITGTCLDLAGNEGNASYTVQVDKTVPDTTFSVAPQTTINLVDVTFEFGGSDDRSGVAGFECQIDGGGFSPCTSPATYTFIPIRATHIFEARAIDNAGNIDPTPINHTWLINPQPALIRIVQDTVPDGPTDFVFQATHNTNSFIPSPFSLDDDTDGTLSNLGFFSELVKGTYYFNQTDTPGHGPPAISCSDPSGGTEVGSFEVDGVIYDVRVDALFGETIECTFTNEVTDTTAPTAAPAQSPPPNAAGWNDGTVVVNWNWDDGTGAGLDPANCPATSAVTGEGEVTVTATCVDLAGNIGSASYTVAQVDATSPDTSFTVAPQTTINLVDVTFEFGGSDDRSGLAGFECNLDGAGWSPCTSPQTYEFVPIRATHVFEARAVDNAGNVDPTPINHTWLINPQPALIRIVQDTVPDGPQDFTFNSASGTFSFLPGTFSLDDDLDGTLPNLGFFSELVKGDYYFRQVPVPGYDTSIACTDPSGGTTVGPVVYQGVTYDLKIDALFGETIECVFTSTLIDVTAPTAAPTVDPLPNGAGWNSGDVTVNWNWADEAGGSGLDTSTCETTTTTTGEGSITVTATCADLAGNVGDASLTVQVDQTAPDATITANPSSPSTSSDATFEFSGSDAGSGVAGLECQVDGGGYSPCTSPLSLTGLADGSHTFEVRAVDVADNTGSAASYTWTVQVAAVPFATCGGHDVFETSPGVYSAPSFVGNLIVGTNGPNALVGTGGADLILGLDGADSLRGRGGNDVICGGRGADVISGGGGADVLYGERGKDILNGDNGKDTLYGGAAADTLNGGAKADVLFGGGGKDDLNGNGGNDDLFGQGGNDDLDGGRGRDDCNGGPGTDTARRCETSAGVEVQ